MGIIYTNEHDIWRNEYVIEYVEYVEYVIGIRYGVKEMCG